MRATRALWRRHLLIGSPSCYFEYREIEDAERHFLSNVQENQGYGYGRNTRLLGRVRQASELASNELGNNPETARSATGALGPFTGYKIAGEEP
jgi:hypothetical protein